MNGMKLQTPVDTGHISKDISLNDRIFVIGSCFADNIGGRMKDLGLDVCINPFGTLYNPVSICNSLARLSSGMHFTEEDCVEMGAEAGLVCSFSHHTSFARKTVTEFLENANAEMDEAADFWKKADKVIVTLGTAWCYEYSQTGEIVSNCLKIDAKKFSRRRLTTNETSVLLRNLISKHPDKDFIFTVSPIRHLKDGAHGNQLSKSTLLLATDSVISKSSTSTGGQTTEYFPAYEIMMDELRDYRFYAEDMVHPSQQAIDYLWSRFADYAFSKDDIRELDRREDVLRRSRHRTILHQS